MTVARLVEDVLGTDLPVAVEAYDGSRLGPSDAPATLLVRTPEALTRIITAPGELGFGRAYVAGDLDVDGDIFAALALRDRLPEVQLTGRQKIAAARLAGLTAFRRLPPRPSQEARLRGRRHSRKRDAAAVTHHYDVSNRFYEIVLGPSLTYSCALFARADMSLEEAQEAKHDLVARKLDLHPGMRLLDVGCGWGGMLLQAARHHGVRAVGVTISSKQADLARKRVADAGLSHLVEIRLQDYRDVDDGPYDAISSIGMFEHVGLSQLGQYFRHLHDLLRPQGRLLNHAISRPPGGHPRIARNSFAGRFVFPDAELHEVGAVVSAIQAAGFEARHTESLREHYALTLRRWVANLQAGWEEARTEVDPGRARIWLLYMAASALNFEANRTQIHQVLGVRADEGRSGLDLRPHW
ncbi:MAG: class I SAM-dependent methyltransferase [Acidimicrobiales bacterium]